MAEVTALRQDFKHPLDADPARAYTLPANYYLDAEIFEREKHAIFYRNWHYVGHGSEVANPGDYVTIRIADENVFVMRGVDGELRGFYNVCRHRAHELLEGAGNVDAIVCPYHAWTYHTDGRLRHARNADKVHGFDAGAFCLPQIRVEIFCGLLFVNLDEDAASLSSLVPDLEADIRARVPKLDALRPVEKWSFGPGEGIEANWKVVMDNFLECYHCQQAHPAFADLFDMSAYQLDTFDLWSRQLGPDIRPDNSAYPVEGADPARTGLFWFLWPTTTINMLPGQANLQVLSILPQGIGQATFAGHRYAIDDSADPQRQSYLNEVLTLEDQDLCESVQRGLRSRSYDQGRFIFSADETGISEHGVHHFHRLVHAALKTS